MSEATRFLQRPVEAPEPLENGILPDFRQERRVRGDGGASAGRPHRGVGGRGGDPGEGEDGGGRGRGRQTVRARLSPTVKNNNSDGERLMMNDYACLIT